MQEIAKGIYSVGVQNPDLRVFDIIMQTPNGTSYNAFLVKGQQKAALIETVKDDFCEEYFRNIEEIMPISDIDYLIINHTEPDHAGTIPKLLKKNPNLTVVGSQSAITFVQHIINQPFNSQVVKKGDALDLGGRTLSFYPMPNLHWPDTMFTFDDQEKALFACDFLGAHHSFSPLLISQVKDRASYLASVEAYYQDIMSPFSQPFVQNGLRCVRELNPSLVLTGHGAIIDEGLKEILAVYDRLSAKKEGTQKTVALVYVSAYGYTRTLAEIIKQELEEAGIQVAFFELDDDNRGQALQAVVEADGALFGSPTFLGDQLQPIGELLSALHPYAMKGKPSSAFGSYGWSGEAVNNIIERLNQIKAKTMEGYRARLKPSKEELEGARDFARRFAKALQAC